MNKLGDYMHKGAEMAKAQGIQVIGGGWMSFDEEHNVTGLCPLCCAAYAFTGDIDYSWADADEELFEVFEAMGTETGLHLNAHDEHGGWFDGLVDRLVSIWDNPLLTPSQTIEALLTQLRTEGYDV